MQNLPSYSALMSVYKNDRAEWLEAAIRSMLNQTHAPGEFVIIEDGPLGDELSEALNRSEAESAGIIRRIALPAQGGLGSAMRIGVTECKNAWIARMDADDISDPERCEKELRAAVKANADIVGCDCAEFSDSVDRTEHMRVFPEGHAELIRFSHRRTPFCHPGVMMRRDAVLRAGNYRDARFLEDYDLFVRMLQAGAIGHTVKEPLIHMRIGRDFYRRRGGLTYAGEMIAFNRRLRKCGWIGWGDCLVRSCGNIAMAVAPVRLRRWMYKRILRK